MVTTIRTSAKPALLRAIARARMAPSEQNRQPWLFHFGAYGLELRLDLERGEVRQGRSDRQAVLDCGRALLNVRVTLAAEEVACAVQRFPDAGAPDLVARVVPVIEDDPAADAPMEGRRLAVLRSVLATSEVGDREALDVELPRAMIGRLARGAAAEGAALVCLLRPDHRNAVLALNRLAERPGVRLPGPRCGGQGGRPLPTLFVLSTSGDNPTDWVRAGEALQRIHLELAVNGYGAIPLTPILDVPPTRAALRTTLNVGFPQCVFRLGRVSPDASAARSTDRTASG